ncbi:MAG TPA: glucose-1-phosphate cytidylyltransferase [Candidatus Nanoarchaeia archaeon]|nr:glucose-1-phosphate cytidylyltransferase [Candidatus Nanoarchaeia archaeon]
MKAVILCGGTGTRLKEETEFKPKPLVKIGNMPILWHIMKIYSHYGVKEFILCLGYKGEMIKEYFLNFEQLANDFTLNLRSKESKIMHHNNNALDDWKIHFVDTGQNTMTGGRIARVQHLLKDDEDFFLTYGDGLASINLEDLYNYHKKKGKILTLTATPFRSQYGIVEINKGMITSFKEKPHVNGRMNGGFFVCNKKIFGYLSRDESCIFEEEPMKKLTKDNELAAYELNDFWYAMDTPKHLKELNDLWEKDHKWKVW